MFIKKLFIIILIVLGVVLLVRCSPFTMDFDFIPEGYPVLTESEVEMRAEFEVEYSNATLSKDFSEPIGVITPFNGNQYFRINDESDGSGEYLSVFIPYLSVGVWASTTYHPDVAVTFFDSMGRKFQSDNRDICKVIVSVEGYEQQTIWGSIKGNLCYYDGVTYALPINGKFSVYDR
jgi:hypothetical protein